MSITATKTMAPYGSWLSDISTKVITQSAPSRDYPCMPHASDGVIYWQESRPAENGRICIVARYKDGTEKDILPYPLSTRSKVHEYGGKSWLIVNHILYFVLQEDQRLYSLDLNKTAPTPIALTHNGDNVRFADLTYDPFRKQLICIQEHHQPEFKEPTNSIVSVSTVGDGKITTLTSGDDFYAYPRLNPEGTTLCWLSWNHPNMPWDATKLCIASVETNGTPGTVQQVAGGPDESIFQPQWSPQGQLYFISDKSGWWNIHRIINLDYRTDYDLVESNHIERLLPMEAEFGLPLWSLGMCTYDFLDEKTIATLYTQNGTWHLGTIDVQTKTLRPLKTQYTQLTSLSCSQGSLLFIGASELIPSDVVQYSAERKLSIIKNSEDPTYKDFISTPRPISYTTTDGELAYGFFYPPENPHFYAADNEKPPLLVICHGGPTGATSAALNYKIQYWTSRGFAVLDVNYRGSTGYGRNYREKLKGQWGIADVDDVVAGVDYLANKGLIDPLRTIIRGSSAGGYTVLAALTFTDTFKAGASLYGIGDLETLAKDTHKFESRYLDKLVGPYPKDRATYLARSPIHHTDRLHCPVIFFQGLEDKVVPPEQAQSMVSVLKDKGIAVAYIPFANEGHGFRQADNIKKAQQSELFFYRAVLGIRSDEILPPINIDNHKA